MKLPPRLRDNKTIDWQQANLALREACAKHGAIADDLRFMLQSEAIESIQAVKPLTNIQKILLCH